MKPLRVALVQTSATDNVAKNLSRISEILANVTDVDLIALPEVFAFRGSDAGYRDVAEPLMGTILALMAELARDRTCWILAGSIIEKEDSAVFNTSVLLDRFGNVASCYRKIHLFEAKLEDGTVIKESDAYDPGEVPMTADIEGWTAGLSICYDVRFPELYRLYAEKGADLMLVPANFTQRTGKDHWETLLRARAIENQCFVIAPNQCGENTATGVGSYGNSMVVGPWGEILCRGGDKEEVLIADLDPGLIQSTRARVPALEHRKL